MPDIDEQNIPQKKKEDEYKSFYSESDAEELNAAPDVVNEEKTGKLPTILETAGDNTMIEDKADDSSNNEEADLPNPTIKVSSNKIAQ